MDRTDLTRRQFLRWAGVGAAGVALSGCRPIHRETGGVEMREQPGSEHWEELAELAMQRARSAGAEYGDVRILHTTRQSIVGQDRRIAGITDASDQGLGVRVLWGGAWGFAASSLLTPEEVRHAVDLALEIARGSASVVQERVRLAPEPVHRGTHATGRLIDPFAVPLEEKTGLLLEIMEALHRQPGIARSSARLWAQRDRKLLVSTEGSHLWFDLLAVAGGFSATAVHEGRFASREFNVPHLRLGYEHIRQADMRAQAERIAAQAVEKVRAPAVDPGRYDLVLDAEHLSLTIHESCGHASELDRALGWEANYAGTSFLTPDQLGRLRYGSSAVNLVADNTEPGCLASTGYDDDGVEGQRWDIVREGVFVGYCTSRETAPKIGESRSRGSCRADSWASIPIVRIANVGLLPGRASMEELIGDVKRGIYIEGHGSFSIDQKRYNFQFGGDAFWLIENGQRKHMLRDVIYTAITPEFWGSCDAVADASHRRRYGFITCGKGQPGQSGWMTHAASPARFRQVHVIRGQSRG